jgi:hypothetical protein
MRARDLTYVVASHPRPAEGDETCKRPLPGTPTVVATKFVNAHLVQMVCSKDIRVYTGLGRMSLRPVEAACVTGTSLQ